MTKYPTMEHAKRKCRSIDHMRTDCRSRMHDASVCALALECLDAPEVLADFIIELGWWHPMLDNPPAASYFKAGAPAGFCRQEYLEAVSLGKEHGRTRLIVAVLLFQAWPTTWPLAQANASHRRVLEWVEALEHVRWPRSLLVTQS